MDFICVTGFLPQDEPGLTYSLRTFCILVTGRTLNPESMQWRAWFNCFFLGSMDYSLERGVKFLPRG